MDTQRYTFKVFIIDDSIFTRNALMDLLPDLGFEIVGMAETAKNAFRYVADTRPDVVLLDISLPKISADEVIRGLLAINPTLEIIILAPLSNQSEISKLLKYGARDFIPKPLVPRQVEYVLKTYELSAGLKPQTEAEKIGEIHSLFYNECLKHAPASEFNIIKKAIYDPLKRLNRVYDDRYKIKLDPIKMELLQAKETHSREIFTMYKVQLDRLYYSIARRLKKEFPLEYVFSFLNEAYQTFYPLAIYLLDSTDYRLPEWENFKLEYYDPSYYHHKGLEQAYEVGLPFNIPDTLIEEENVVERLSPYRTVIHHDPRTAPKFPKPTQVSVDNLDIHILLSYFDDIMGPIAGVIVPPPHGRLEKDQLQSIPRLMDMMGAIPGEPFIHSASNYGSINLIFTVQLDVRGGIRDYMLSVVINPAEIREMVKINQMGSVLKAIGAEISNFYRQNPELTQSDKKLTSEPEKILMELLQEVRRHLQ